LSRRFAVLLSADELAPAYRWRLVKDLYAQSRSLIQGTLTILLAQLTCWLHTGLTGFALLASITAALLVGRLTLTRAFERRRLSAAGEETGTPEHWALLFSTGAVAIAVQWAFSLALVMFFTHDAVVQMFVVMCAAGWVSAAGVRNAASPLSVLLQTWVTCGAAAVFAAIGGNDFTRYLAPFALVMATATLSIADYMREQAVHAMLAEQRLAEANARLTELSATDGLTGIGNRRAFDAVLQTEWTRATRERAGLSLLLIDVDFFKLFNDRYGHPAGDQCLRTIAALMRDTLRTPPDYAARFGGEEFVAVLPGTTEAEAMDVADRLCNAVLAARMKHADSVFGVVSVSIGVASAAPSRPDGCKTLIDRADDALYRAKHAGRNRARSASDNRPSLDEDVMNSGRSGTDEMPADDEVS
jgi:diguanylate cyclase (GGDEF)-like protein